MKKNIIIIGCPGIGLEIAKLLAKDLQHPPLIVAPTKLDRFAQSQQFDPSSIINTRWNEPIKSIDQTFPERKSKFHK